MLAIRLVVSLVLCALAYVAMGRWTSWPPGLACLFVVALAAAVEARWLRAWSDFIYSVVGALAGVYIGYALYWTTVVLWGF